MRINDDHMYHGAALTQIAEHRAFTAINAFKRNGDKSRSAFRINDNIGAFIKYASAPRGKHDEYLFTFQKAHLRELALLREQCRKVFVVLVCIEDKEICVLSDSELNRLITSRSNAFGRPEDQYQVLVTAPANKQFRVYVNSPRVKGQALGETMIKRSAFPGALFSTVEAPDDTFSEIPPEVLVPAEDVAVTVSRGGYLKRIPVDAYRRQTRGGKGRIGMSTRAEDVVEHLIIASTHAYLLIFTNKGRLYWLKIYNIPDAGTTGKGKHCSGLINLQPDETVTAFLPVKEFVAGRERPTFR